MGDGLDGLADALRASASPPFRRNAKGSILDEDGRVVVMRASGDPVFRLAPERVDELCAAGTGTRYRGTMRAWIRCPGLSPDAPFAVALAREALVVGSGR